MRMLHFTTLQTLRMFRFVDAVKVLLGSNKVDADEKCMGNQKTVLQVGQRADHIWIYAIRLFRNNNNN